MPLLLKSYALLELILSDQVSSKIRKYYQQQGPKEFQLFVFRFMSIISNPNIAYWCDFIYLIPDEKAINDVTECKLCHCSLCLLTFVLWSHPYIYVIFHLLTCTRPETLLYITVAKLCVIIHGIQADAEKDPSFYTSWEIPCKKMLLL